MPSDADTASAAVPSSTAGAVETNGADAPIADKEQPSTTDSSSQPATTADTATATSTPAPATAAPSTAEATTAPSADASSSSPSSTTAATSSSSSSSSSSSTFSKSSSKSPSTPTPFPSDATLLSHLRSYLQTADFNVVTNKTIMAHLEEHFHHELSSKKAIIKAAIKDFIDNPTAQQHSNGTDGNKQQHDNDTDMTQTETKTEAADGGQQEEEQEQEEEEQTEETQEEIDHRLAMELAAEDRRPRRTAAADSIKRAEKRKAKESTAASSSSTTPPTKKPKTKSTKAPTLYSLSPALSAFLPGHPTHSSWGDVVKELWVYIKAESLQDARNKKRIVCDERLRSVFGKDRKTVDAFKMNKFLTKHMKKSEDLA